MQFRIYLLFVFFIFTTCSESTDTKLQRFLLKGNEELRKGNQQQALYYFQQSLQLDSCFADALNNIGTIYFNQGRYPQAQQAYDKCAACNPNFVNVYFNRANNSYELKEYYRSLKDLDYIRKIKPDTFPLHFTEGLVYTKMRNFHKAKQSFLKAISLSTNNTEVIINLASVLYYQKDFTEATRLLQQAISLDPNIANAYNTLALVQIEEGQLDQALLSVNKALAISKDDAYALNNRGYIYLLQNKLPQALEDINASVLSDPNNAWAYRNKGIYYLKMKDYPNAMRLLQQAKYLDDFVEDVDEYISEAQRNLVP
jgi:tetratricopeptide (TPR) repeat protein